MVHNFAEELFPEHGLILCGVSGVPDPRLTHEIESGAMNHSGVLTLRIGSEEYRGAEDPLERPNQPPILGSALLHAESVQHLRGAAELNHSTLLFDRQSCEEEGTSRSCPQGKP